MKQKYASLFDRVKAAFIDGVTIIILIYVISMFFNLFETVPNYFRGGLFFLIFVLYEPILVSLFGRTLGHLFFDIIVKNESNEKKNLLLHSAIVRYFLKILLGWLSLLTVTGNEKRQAIHDIAARSVVLSIKS